MGDTATGGWHWRANLAIEVIHGARKSLKRLRTVVRLCRDQLGDDRYHAENASLRDAGRALAATRDAAALPKVLEALVADHEGEVDADELAACGGSWPSPTSRRARRWTVPITRPTRRW